MLSAADFPDVFPTMAERLPGHARESRIEPAIARWEDDGGRTSNRASASRPPSREREVSSGLVPWFVPFAVAPALAVATMAILGGSRTTPPR